MKSTKTLTRRRTRADINLLSITDVTAGLVAAGIIPIEEFLIEDRLFILKELPRLEPHQRWNWMEYAPRSTDCFVLDHYTRFPQDDLPTTWRKQLFDHELSTFVNGLSLASLKAQLKTVSVDEHFDRKPEPTWNAEDYRRELASRITELEKPTIKPKRKATR